MMVLLTVHDGRDKRIARCRATTNWCQTTNATEQVARLHEVDLAAGYADAFCPPHWGEIPARRPGTPGGGGCFLARTLTAVADTDERRRSFARDAGAKGPQGRRCCRSESQAGLRAPCATASPAILLRYELRHPQPFRIVGGTALL